MIPVILESPYGPSNGLNIEENVRYARACLLDCLIRGEAPFASHLLYTQPGVLKDELPTERDMGIQAGFVWRPLATYTVFYTNLGWSAGMRKAQFDCENRGLPFQLRSLPTY